MTRLEVFEALELGARGIVTRQVTPPLLIKGIHCVAAGEYWVHRDLLVEWLRTRGRRNHSYQLTKRERQIVHKVLTGASNKKIGSSCGITEATTSRHLANIYKKLGVSRRSELVSYAVNHRL
jgi:DNA-binding NarL/FixJ family response regulator